MAKKIQWGPGGKILWGPGGKIAWDPDCCCGEECGACIGGVGPSQFQVDLAGIANQDCNACGVFNDSYVLDFERAGLSYCTWSYGSETGPCDALQCDDGFSVNLTIYNGGYVVVNLVVPFESSSCGPSNNGVWAKSGTGMLDCASLSNYDIPWSQDNTTRCDFTGSTCKVTAL